MEVIRILGRRWYLVLLGIAFAFGAAWFLAPEERSLHQALAVIRLDDARPANSAEQNAEAIDARGIEYMVSQSHIVRGEGLVGEVVDLHGLRLWPANDIPFRLLGDVEVSAPAAASDTILISFDAATFTVRNSAGARASGRYGAPMEFAGARFTVVGRPSAVVQSHLRIIPRHEVVNTIIEYTSAIVPDVTALMSITYRDPDEDRAMRVVNAIADVYRDYSTRGLAGEAQRRVAFLQDQLIEAEGAVLQLQQVLRQSQEVDLSYGALQRLQTEQANLTGLQDQLRQLEEERRVYGSFLTRIEGATRDQVEAELRTLMASPGLAQSPVLAPMFGQLNNYQLERARLLASGLAPTNPQVEQLTQLIGATLSQITQAAGTRLASLDSEIGSVSGQVDRGLAALRSMSTLGSDDERLRDDVAAAQATVTALRNEYEIARMDASLNAGNVQVVAYATYTTEVVVGQRMQILILAFLVGLVLGGGSALLVEAGNTSIRGRAEVEDLLAVPGLAVIPRINAGGGRPGRKSLLGRGSRKGKAGVRKVQVGAIAGGNPSISPELQEFHSISAEAYRMLRTNLIFLHPDREMRTLMVSSASSGEGKTTTTVNLAVAFARQGKRVLLVDCDLRRPRVHTFFGMDASPGFTDLILNTRNAANAIRPTGIDRLSLLPRGEFDERAVEMLSGSVGRELIAKLRERWDLVIFDTSPILLTADAAAVAPNTDGVLLVVRAGHTPREAARQAMQQMNVVGATVLGFVLNDPDAVGQQYGEGKYTKEYYSVEV